MIGKFPKGIFIAINQLIACIAPPLTAIFLLGILWKRTTSRAAELGLWVGEPLCIIFGLSRAFGWPEGLWPQWLNFMFLAFLMLIIIIVFMILVSLVTEPPKAEKTLPSLREISKTDHIKIAQISGGILAVIMIILYIIFN